MTKVVDEAKVASKAFTITPKQFEEIWERFLDIERSMLNGKEPKNLLGSVDAYKAKLLKAATQP